MLLVDKIWMKEILFYFIYLFYFYFSDFPPWGIATLLRSGGLHASLTLRAISAGA